MMQCDTSLLWTLVEQSNDPGVEAESIARHLETCARCRRELDQLGGDDQWWQEAEQCLTDNDSQLESPLEPNNGDRQAESDCIPLPPVDLSFLEEPSHPEMLGRIGRYDVEEFLGRGGMGVVLRAYDSDLRRSVAVKVLAPEWAASVPARKRFAREAQAAASVAHENVVPIYNVESEATLPFLVMRYIPGMTLEQWVRTHGPPDPATVLRVAGQLVEGLAAAHRRGLVHRDIKPGNVLVGENIERVWLTDFGLAKAADSMTLTRTGVIAGTPHYMSPEQARGDSVDQRSDLFSLGSLLYFLCAGHPPFEAENTLAVLHQLVNSPPNPLAFERNDLPPSLVSLVHQLLSRSSSKRPVDCGRVLARLKDANDELEQGRVAKRPWSRRTRKIAFGIASLSATLILGFVSLQAWQSIDPGSRPERSITSAVPNPWNTGQNSTEDASPYLTKASEHIDRVATADDVQYQRQFADIQQRIKRMESTFPLTFAGDAVVTSPAIDDSIWQRRVTEIEFLIHRSDSSH